MALGNVNLSFFHESVVVEINFILRVVLFDVSFISVELFVVKVYFVAYV